MMTEIFYNKEIAFNRLKFDWLLEFVGVTFGVNIAALGVAVIFEFPIILGLVIASSICSLVYGVKIYFIYLYIKTLKQSYDEHELRTEYKIILDKVKVARLQIVNNVDINQGFIDKLFGLYNVEVDYGFGDNGYVHVFNFLTKDQAEKIAEAVRVKTDLGVLLRGKK